MDRCGSRWLAQAQRNDFFFKRTFEGRCRSHPRVRYLPRESITRGIETKQTIAAAWRWNRPIRELASRKTSGRAGIVAKNSAKIPPAATNMLISKASV